MTLGASNEISNNQLRKISMLKNSLSQTENPNDAIFALVMQNVVNSNENSFNSTKNQYVEQQVMPGQNLENLQIRLNENLASTYNKHNTYNNVNSSSGDSQMKTIYNAVNKAASKYDVDPNLILAIIKHESDFKPNVTSSAGAVGLMQVMPQNFADNNITDGYDIEQNINGGTKLLKKCLDLYDGDLKMGLMAYAAGPGMMKRRGVSSGDDLYKMPAETKKAVPEILSDYRNRAK